MPAPDAPRTHRSPASDRAEAAPATVSARRRVAFGHRTAVRPRAGERGIIVPMVALSLVAVLLVATIVIDGSLAYPQRRAMQNAADVAAVNGARQLDQAKYFGASWTTVDAKVQEVASANGAERATCTIINNTGSDIGSCTNQTAVQHANAAGVKVRAEDDRKTTFGPLSGREKVTAGASASATIQTLRGTGSPFVICGDASKGGYPILDANGVVNPTTATAMGKIPVQDSQIPSCGAGSAFKGKIDDDDVNIPEWVEADNGNGFDAAIYAEVLGATACPKGGPFTDCDMLIPIANNGAGNGQDIYMYAVAWAVFHITGDGTGNPKYYGEFRSDKVYVSGGATVNQLPGNNFTPRVVRLIA